MKPHKHAELIKAWADGAEIQRRVTRNKDDPISIYSWLTESMPMWVIDEEYRIKPRADWTEERTLFWNRAVGCVIEGDTRCNMWMNNPKHYEILGDFLLTFDGETGELKSAEVLK